MGRRASVGRILEQKLEIVLAGVKSGNSAETCRHYEIAPNLYCTNVGKTKLCGGRARRLGGEAPRPRKTKRSGGFTN